MDVPLGHKVKPPTCDPDALFGPARYTLAQQAASPDQPMTRVVKDILRVGRWNIGGPDGGDGEMWTVDQATLVALARSVAAKQDAGHGTNFTLSHGDANMDIETEDLIAPIDAVRADGNTLWMALYVTPRQAKFVLNPAVKVSVGTINDYEDGSGNRYTMCLDHVAAVDRPVVGGQGRFMLAMSNSARPTKPLTVRDRANIELMGLGLKPVPSHVSESAIPAFLAGARRATTPRTRR